MAPFVIPEVETDWIGKYGFPIFVACWLLWERWTLGRRLDRALNEVNEHLRTLTKQGETTRRFGDRD